MADLINSVQDGKLIQNSTSSTSTTQATSSLGKDAFLQLLATQMKYQDPLNPNTDTQFVAQLATFSQLEQMQNLNSTSTNSQAFGLVGKNVIMKSTDAAGSATYVSGKVNFATMTNGKAYLSINGNLYPAASLDTVIDDAFLDSLGLPSVAKKDLTFDKADPKDQTFAVNLGSNKNVATSATVKIGETTVESKYVSITNGYLTIQKEALTNLAVGTNKVEVIFNDTSKTAVADQITLSVVNSAL